LNRRKPCPYYALVLCLLLVVSSATLGHGATPRPPQQQENPIFDVLVYGSTPSGILAAVAAARHLGTNKTTSCKRNIRCGADVSGSCPCGVGGGGVALLSQRAHIGGVASGGLGQTDIGCEETTHGTMPVIGGLALEFFQRNAAKYDTVQHRSPWNLEPHVAKQVFLEMLREANVTLLHYGEVESVLKNNDNNHIESITMVGTGQRYKAKVFVDASYEGDLMARTPDITYTYGRESQAQYNESGAGSQGATAMEYPYEYFDPFDKDGNLLPLLRKEFPLPKGQADKQIQAYNFRLCVTKNSANATNPLRVPFTKPDDYDPQMWELLRRFWRHWPNSKSPHKAAQGQAPTAILGKIPSMDNKFEKFDANNCGWNIIHTDMIGGSWEYPEANYSYRKTICKKNFTAHFLQRRSRFVWSFLTNAFDFVVAIFVLHYIGEAHVSYTKSFLWFMSSDASVPEHIRSEYANVWGYCGDEFHETDHFPPQLYVREARRLVGERVFTQNDATSKVPRGNESVGMGCYGFDSHCEERYACTDPKVCTVYDKPYVNLQCGCGLEWPGVYQIPVWVLFPKKTQVKNLVVPVCSSASHVAYATIRMEPQFMILGHTAGVVAALSVQNGDAHQAAPIQDVNEDKLAEQLLGDGQLLKLPDDFELDDIIRDSMEQQIS